jgi:hypothetical protein
MRNFQYHHFIEESNTSKTYNVSQYQLPLAPTFCLIDFKAQGQTFEHLIIGLCQPPNSIQLYMHNMYVTFSCLHFLDGLIILRDITIKDIRKVNFKINLKKGSLEMTKPILKSNISQINTPTQYLKLIEEKKEYVKINLRTLLK